MKKIAFLYFILLISISAKAQYTVTGGISTIQTYSDGLGGTGVEKVYLLNTLSGATISYDAPTGAAVAFHYYTNSIGDKTFVPSTPSPNGGTTTHTITNIIDNKGYFVEVNGSPKAAVWIIDYTLHLPILNSISAVEDVDRCENLKLVINKFDENLFYYTNGGLKKLLKRKYTIEYENLVWDDANKLFNQETKKIENKEIGTEYILNRDFSELPLMDTEFVIKGDKYAQEFGISVSTTSPPYQAVATEAHWFAEQEMPDGSMSTTLGGSAPARIHFYGYGNRPTAYYYTWLIYLGTDRDTPIARYMGVDMDRDMDYTFNTAGDYTVLLEVADASSVCSDTVEITFNISESELEVPNYFSPGNDQGVNYEFRVAHKSLVKFKCTIFNRWGVKLYQWTDPEKGWDGRYKGKLVNPGVYFYVIEATGSEGKKYKKAGDINILYTNN